MNKDIDIVPRYSDKAAAYQQYRWPFERRVVRALLTEIGLQPDALVVDIGCGTGMSSQPFLQEGYQVLGIEPNAEMRQVAERNLAAGGGFKVLNGRAEATGLPDQFADLIVVGRALHWFFQAAARTEFFRISKPGGWLAIMSVSYLDAALQEAWRSMHQPEVGWDVAASKHNRKVEPLHFFFTAGKYQTIRGVQSVRESWDQFFGRLLTMSTSPNSQDKYFKRFEQCARAMFDEFREDNDELVFGIMTEIVFGHPASR